jgi:hypothetical protein
MMQKSNIKWVTVVSMRLRGGNMAMLYRPRTRARGRGGEIDRGESSRARRGYMEHWCWVLAGWLVFGVGSTT